MIVRLILSVLIVGLVLVAALGRYFIWDERHVLALAGERAVCQCPAPFRDCASLRVGKAAYDQYDYQWATDNVVATATFAPRPLPGDNDVVVGALRHAAKSVFKVSLTGEPIYGRERRAGQIWLASDDHNKYQFTLNQTDAGELHSFSIQPWVMD